jgi:threonine/homoserine/homoserine lactone efflux protein
MKAKSAILLLYIARLVGAAMLVFAAAEKQPDSLYTLLRWICCAVFAYSAVPSFQIKARALAVGFCRAGGSV